MMHRALGASTGLLLAMLLVGSAATGPVVAADKGKADKAKDKPSKAAAGLIESIKGDDFRMDSAKMADRVVRISDAREDQTFTDGTPAPAARAWSDIAAVYVAPTRMPAKLRNKMAVDYPPGVVGAFYGNAADWRARDRAIFVAVEMDDAMPDGSGGQQVEIGLGGNDATPVQAGTRDDTRIGVERFELSGLFSNGAYATAATDVGGRQPGEDIDYYNAESGVFGFYSPRRSTWYLIVPRAGDTDVITVSVRSSAGVGEVVDRLELPGGGHFIDLNGAAGGWGGKTGLPPLSCRSLETYSAAGGSVDLDDPESTLVRYTAGVDGTVSAQDAARLLGPAIEAKGTVPVELTAVGSDAAPLTVDGELAVSPAGNAVSLTFEAPPGQWRFALATGADPRTPAGESIFDHSTLTGTAGVLTGPGLDGVVAGDVSCAADPAPTGQPG